MITAPLIAGVGKGAGTTPAESADSSLAGFLGASDLDFKSIVAGFFAEETPNDKSPAIDPLADGRVSAGRKLNTHGVENEKTAKAKPELRADAAFVPVTVIVPQQSEVTGDRPRATSGAETVPSERMDGTTEAGPFPVADPVADLEADVVTDPGIQPTANPGAGPGAKPVAGTEVAGARQAKVDTSIAGQGRVSNLASFHELSPEVWDVQKANPSVGSFHRVNSQRWQLDGRDEVMPSQKAAPEAVIAEATTPEEAVLSENDDLPASPVPSEKVVSGFEEIWSRLKHAEAAAPKSVDAETRTGTDGPEKIAPPPTPQGQTPSANRAVLNPTSTKAAENPESSLTAITDDKVPAPADAKTTSTQVLRPAKSQSRVYGQDVLKAAVLDQTIATVAASDGASVTPLHAVEHAVAQVAVASSEPAAETPADVANSVPTTAPQTDVPTPRVEERKGQPSAGRVDGSGKGKARRDGKDTSMDTSEMPANSQVKHVEAPASVLSGGINGINKDGGHASPSKPGPSATVTNGQAASTAIDSDGGDDVLPTVHAGVNTAKLVQTLGQTEFRVGMQSREFGSVDIRTSVARHMFSAQISVEHNDVARNLATELPALVDRLAEQQVLVGNILIHNSGLATSSGLGQDAQAQNGKPQAASVATKAETEGVHPAVIESASSSARLDIRI